MEKWIIDAVIFGIIVVFAVLSVFSGILIFQFSADIGDSYKKGLGHTVSKADVFILLYAVVMLGLCVWGLVALL